MSILEKIYNACLKFLVPLTPEEMYATIVEEAVKLVDGKHGSILLASNGNLERVYATSDIFYTIKPRKRGIRYQVFEKRTPKILHAKNTKLLEKEYPGFKEAKGRSVIFIPLYYKNESIGLLSILSVQDKYFSNKDLAALKLFGSMASLAIRNIKLYDRTKHALETRDLFMSMAAHEFRTPLTTIDGYVQLMKQKMKNKKSIQYKWFEDLSLELNRLKMLVDEFLEINRIKTGKLQYEWKESHLRKIIKRAIVIFNFNRPNRRIIFKNKLNSIKDSVIGDRNKLIQVFTNILENADKYSSSDKDIEVTLKYRNPDYVLEIVDKGQGIAKEEIPLIFRDFYKGKNSQHEGMGLGLYLAKNIIENHKGSIDIKSKVGKGTNVQIRLPKIKLWLVFN